CRVAASISSSCSLVWLHRQAPTATSGRRPDDGAFRKWPVTWASRHGHLVCFWGGHQARAAGVTLGATAGCAPATSSGGILEPLDVDLVAEGVLGLEHRAHRGKRFGVEGLERFLVGLFARADAVREAEVLERLQGVADALDQNSRREAKADAPKGERLGLGLG